LNLIPYLPAVGAGLVAGLLILVEARSVRLALLAIQYGVMQSANHRLKCYASAGMGLGVKKHFTVT